MEISRCAKCFIHLYLHRENKNLVVFVVYGGILSDSSWLNRLPPPQHKLGGWSMWLWVNLFDSTWKCVGSITVHIQGSPPRHPCLCQYVYLMFAVGCCLLWSQHNSFSTLFICNKQWLNRNGNVCYVCVCVCQARFPYSKLWDTAHPAVFLYKQQMTTYSLSFCGACKYTHSQHSYTRGTGGWQAGYTFYFADLVHRKLSTHCISLALFHFTFFFLEMQKWNRDLLNSWFWPLELWIIPHKS